MHFYTNYALTVDRKILVRKKFSTITFNDEIKPTKYFLRCINGVSLYVQVVIMTKIKPSKNLTNDIFYRLKIPNLRYAQTMHVYIHVNGQINGQDG